jgi:hypothetical protein
MHSEEKQTLKFVRFASCADLCYLPRQQAINAAVQPAMVEHSGGSYRSFFGTIVLCLITLSSYTLLQTALNGIGRGFHSGLRWDTKIRLALFRNEAAGGAAPNDRTRLPPTVALDVEPRILPATQPYLWSNFNSSLEAGINSSSVLVLVTGSQLDLLEMQKATFGRHFSSVYTTPDTHHACVICGNTSSSLGSDLLFVNPQYRFKDMDMGWYCAQQRILQSVKRVAPMFLEGAFDWLITIDDDTFLNSYNLVRQLSGRNDSTAQAYGQLFSGGAGFILNRAAVARLLSAADITEYYWDLALHKYTAGSKQTYIDVCLKRVLGGNWCYAHSDHSMGYCLQVADIPSVLLEGMYQFCPVGKRDKPYLQSHIALHNNKPSLWSSALNTTLANDMITCHYMDVPTMQGLHELATARANSAHHASSPGDKA